MMGIKVSKIKNCPAVSVPIMMHLGPRPVVQSLTKPVSLAMFARRESMPPSPPAPYKLIFERSESAGCEMMAAATPAMKPEVTETPILDALLRFSLLVGNAL